MKIWHSLVFIVCCLLSPHSLSEERCQILSRVCVEGAETRTINGVNITKDCWRFDEEYFCRTGEYTDTCSGLTGSCELLTDTCTSTSPTGACLYSSKTYQCGAKQPDNTPATLLDSTYTVVKDSIDQSQCSSYADNTTCQVTGNVCLEGAETRTINGKPIHKECWKWEKQYTCISDSYDDYCEPLETICTETKSECLSQLGDGTCVIEQKTFDCDDLQPNNSGVIHIDTERTIIKDELEDLTCEGDTGPNCVLESRTCTQGPETRMINGLPIYKDCWHYQNEYTCLSDSTVSTCDEIDGNACTIAKESCLLTADDGSCTSTVKEYECTFKYNDKTVMNCGEQIFCLGDDCYDTGYEPNNDFGVAAAYLGVVTSAGKDVADAQDIDIFTGFKSTCAQYPLNTSDCCSDDGWANGSVTGCSNDDKALIQQRASKLTHYVGTYCSKKLPVVKTCIQYKQSYCTYTGMLARIIQEGGRAQLGISWGSAKNPTCDGFSPDDLQKVDFTLIDFQEYIDEMKVEMIDNNEIAKEVEEKVKQLTK